MNKDSSPSVYSFSADRGSDPRQSRAWQLATVRAIVIYPGIGLPEWSSPVVRGKHYQEREEKINQAIENVKELHRTKRVLGHSRNDSTGSSISGPPSPSAQWKIEGAIRLFERQVQESKRQDGISTRED